RRSPTRAPSPSRRLSGPRPPGGSVDVALERRRGPERGDPERIGAGDERGRPEAEGVVLAVVLNPANRAVLREPVERVPGQIVGKGVELAGNEGSASTK